MIIQETGEGITFTRKRPVIPIESSTTNFYGDYRIPMHPDNAFLIRLKNPDNFMYFVKVLRKAQLNSIHKFIYGSCQSFIRKKDIEELSINGLKLKHMATVKIARNKIFEKGDIIFRRVGSFPKDEYTYGAVGDIFYIADKISNARPFGELNE